MKKTTRTFLRSFYLSLVIIMCLAFGWLGISTAYENTKAIGFGEYKKAGEFSDGNLRILDFTIEI